MAGKNLELLPHNVTPKGQEARSSLTALATVQPKFVLNRLQNVCFALGQPHKCERKCCLEHYMNRFIYR